MPKMAWNEADLIEAGILRSRGTAGRAVKRGELPEGFRVGQEIKWLVDDVRDHLRSRKGQTAFASGNTSSPKRKVIKRSRS